jgi:hypothetical protein
VVESAAVPTVTRVLLAALATLLLLPLSYPTLSKQQAPLSARAIFGSRRGFALQLRDRVLAPADGPTGYTSFSESFRGESEITLRRL